MQVSGGAPGSCVIKVMVQFPEFKKHASCGFFELGFVIVPQLIVHM